MRLNFDVRFPMSELICVGALLDPRCQNLLDVKNYLTSIGTTPFNVLKKWVAERVPKSFPIEKAKDKELNFVEELLEKHSSLKHIQKTVQTELDVDKEIHLLMSLPGNVAVNSIRLFWKSYAKQMLILSKLAKNKKDSQHSNDEYTE